MEEIYTKPRRGVPHPDETPISPYDKQELVELEETRVKRDLLITAKTIRTTEAQVQGALNKPHISGGADLRNANPTIRGTHPSISRHYPEVRRAKTHQRNLETAYQKWTDLVEKHTREVANNTEE